MTRFYDKTPSKYTKAALAMKYFPQHPSKYGWKKLMDILADEPALATVRHARRRYLTQSEYALIVSLLGD